MKTTFSKVRSGYIRILYRDLQPSISSPISNLDASEKGLDFERLDGASMFMRETGNSSFLEKYFKIHNFTKFGPSDQLILRGMSLSEDNRGFYNSILAKRDILVERIFHSTNTEDKTETDFETLKDLNNQLENFNFPEPNWGKIYPTIESIKSALEEEELYLDYRVNELRDEIDLFIISTDTQK